MTRTICLLAFMCYTVPVTAQTLPTDEELRASLDHCQSQLVQRPRLQFTEEFVKSCQAIGDEITRRLEAKNKPAKDESDRKVQEIIKRLK